MASATRIVYLILLFAIGSNGDSENFKGGTVTVLTDKNFAQFISSTECALVLFYAPWCGYSQALLSIYTIVAQILAVEHLPVKLAKINSPQNPITQKKYKIYGYPTLKFFKKGKVIDYTGDRTSSSIVSFVKLHAS